MDTVFTKPNSTGNSTMTNDNSEDYVKVPRQIVDNALGLARYEVEDIRTNPDKHVNADIDVWIKTRNELAKALGRDPDDL